MIPLFLSYFIKCAVIFVQRKYISYMYMSIPKFEMNGKLENVSLLTFNLLLLY